MRHHEPRFPSPLPTAGLQDSVGPAAHASVAVARQAARTGRVAGALAVGGGFALTALAIGVLPGIEEFRWLALAAPPLVAIALVVGARMMRPHRGATRLTLVGTAVSIAAGVVVAGPVLVFAALVIQFVVSPIGKLVVGSSLPVSDIVYGALAGAIAMVIGWVFGGPVWRGLARSLIQVPTVHTH